MSYAVKKGKNNSIIFNIYKKLERESFLDFQNDIDRVLEQEYSCYVFYFDKMEFLPSRAIGIILSLRKRLGKDTPVYLVSPSLYIVKILDILNITDYFQIVDNIDSVYEKKMLWRQN